MHSVQAVRDRDKQPQSTDQNRLGSYLAAVDKKDT